MHETVVRGRRRERGSNLRSEGFASEFERVLQLRKINCARVDILRVRGKLGNRGAFEAVYLARLLHLLYRGVPLLLRLLPGLLGLLRSGVFHAFLALVVSRCDEIHGLSKARRDLCLHRNMSAV